MFSYYLWSIWLNCSNVISVSGVQYVHLAPNISVLWQSPATNFCTMSFSDIWTHAISLSTTPFHPSDRWIVRKKDVQQTLVTISSDRSLNLLHSWIINSIMLMFFTLCCLYYLSPAPSPSLHPLEKCEVIHLMHFSIILP